MGKTVGSGSGSQKQVRMKGALGKHIGRYLDQYTIICVFGSVVGYAVMPLIGTVETLVLSVIVIGLSIHGLSKNSHREDDRRKSRDDKKAKRQELKRSLHVQVITDSETQKRQREDVLKASKYPKALEEDDEETEEIERLRRLEEKREKKARKKVERNKRREEEKKEKEREEQARRERQEQRALKKQQEKEAKEKARGFLFPTYETIKAMVTTQKLTRRERKHSTSSNSSGSSSTRSHPHTPPRFHPVPVRASSDPTLYPSTKTSAWSANSAESANTTFPNLPVPGQSTLPWSHYPQTITSSTPNIWSEVPPIPPQHTSTAAQTTWDNQTSPTAHQPRWVGGPVDTLTPNQAWSQSQLYPNSPEASDSSLWQNFNIWQDKRQQNGGFSPLTSPNGRFYSLFSKEISSPFTNLQSSSSVTTAAGGHVTNTERRLGNNHLAGTCSAESSTGPGEWPTV